MTAFFTQEEIIIDGLTLDEDHLEFSYTLKRMMYAGTGGRAHGYW